MIILAIQYNSHDTSVALIKDNQILYAASNERFSRLKMDKRIPLFALKECLKFTKISPAMIDKIAIVGHPFPLSFVDIYKFFTMPLILTKGKYLFWLKKPSQILKAIPYLSVIPAYLYKEVYPLLILKLALRGFKGKIVFVPHHEAHLYAAYYTSGWNECLVGCIEGGGIIKSTSLYYVKNNTWTKIMEDSLPNSTGLFYALATRLIGFKPTRHEGKVTGLSAYGNPHKAYKFVSSLLWVEGKNLKVDYNKWLKTVVDYEIHKKTDKEIQHIKKEDIAAAFQKRLEVCILAIIKKALTEYKTNKIALAGGVVANVKLNQRIFELPSINNIYIYPAMGDDGIALGAALHIGHHNGMKFQKLKDVYFGPEYSPNQILKALKKYRVKYNLRKNIEQDMAKLLAEGAIIARFNGRMEYGPRALGNRSILCPAIDPDINTTLNHKLHRTEFMPFAPVILKECVNLCFQNIKGAEHPAKFMTITLNCTDYLKNKCPAVVHVDGTARPQIIDKATNPSYYKILKYYYKMTGIPALINTSYNMHEEPIVCTPDDAVRAFLESNLDYLAIGNYLVKTENI